MSLSSLIVQRGLATMRQVEEALAHQVIYGSDLVTNLLEVASVDETEVARLFAESVVLEPAPVGELPRAPGRLRTLVPPEMAAQRSIVPIEARGDTLVLAVAEPLPREVEQELAFAFGMHIEQRAALAVRVRQAIASAYELPLERRVQRLVARLSGQPWTPGSMPAPLGAIPEVPRMPMLPSLTATLPHQSSLPPQPAPAAAERSPVLLRRDSVASGRPGRRRRGPLTLEEASLLAGEESERDALLDLFFDFSRQFFDYSALFLVHGEVAEGREAFGSGATRDHVQTVGIPLDVPSMMREARDGRAPIVGKPPAGGLDAELRTDLLRPLSAEIAVVPLVVRTRAVALLLGDCEGAGIDREAIGQVTKLCAVVATGFERMIARRKLEGFGAGNPESAPGRVDGAMMTRKRPPFRPSRPQQSAFNTLSSGPPPPSANIASVRPIAGPPISREEPLTPPAPRPDPPPAAPIRSARPARSMPPEAPCAPVRSVAPERPRAPIRSVPPPRSVPPGRSSPPLPSVPPDYDLAPLVDRVLAGEATELDEASLLRQGDMAMRLVMAHFPGPLTFPRTRAATLPSPPRPSECGPLLRFVARARKAALPFVIERIDDSDPEIRGWATYLACELPYAELIPRLVPRLRDTDAVTRASAAHALAAIARIFRDEVRATLLALVRGPDPEQRSSAMPVVAVLRDATLVPELVRALGDGDEWVVAAAHAALVHVARQDFGPGAWPWVRWWEENRGRHRVEWLIDALTHDRLDIRRAAGEELRTLAREYFGYASDLPTLDRQRVQQRYRDWWSVEGRTRFPRT